MNRAADMSLAVAEAIACRRPASWISFSNGDPVPRQSAVPIPRVGLEFIHRRILGADGWPARCTVSAIRGGLIYYRVGDERKAKEFATPDRWPMIASPIMNPNQQGDEA